MEKAGASPDNIARELAKLPAADPEDLPEIDADDEGKSFGLFMALSTQWKTAGLSAIRTGLDYSAVAPVAAGLKIEVTPQIFLDLQLMEQEALKVQSERLAAEAARSGR